MNTKTVYAFAAALGMAVTVLAGAPAFAEKHDSNTLHKLGNAIQYPVRKAGENLSVNAHRAVHEDSHVSDRPHNRKVIITAEGKKYAGRPDQPYAHRRWTKKHHRHVRHHRKMHHKI